MCFCVCLCVCVFRPGVGTLPFEEARDSRMSCSRGLGVGSGKDVVGARTSALGTGTDASEMVNHQQILSREVCHQMCVMDKLRFQCER